MDPARPPTSDSAPVNDGFRYKANWKSLETPRVNAAWDRGDTMSDRSNSLTKGRWISLLPILAGACSAPEGLMASEPAEVTVKFDFDQRGRAQLQKQRSHFG